MCVLPSSECPIAKWNPRDLCTLAIGTSIATVSISSGPNGHLSCTRCGRHLSRALKTSSRQASDGAIHTGQSYASKEMRHLRFQRRFADRTFWECAQRVYGQWWCMRSDSIDWVRIEWSVGYWFWAESMPSLQSIISNQHWAQMPSFIRTLRYAKVCNEFGERSVCVHLCTLRQTDRSQCIFATFGTSFVWLYVLTMPVHNQRSDLFGGARQTRSCGWFVEFLLFGF